MSRQVVEQTYAEFLGGFSSEYNELSRPEGFIKDSVNFIVTKQGTLEKRPGLLPLSETYLGDIPNVINNESFYQVFLWKLRDHPEIEEIVVMQIRNFVFFFKREGDSIDFSDYLVRSFAFLEHPVQSPYSGHFSFAQSQDNLIICAGNRPPQIVSVNKIPGVFNLSTRSVDIKIRDTSVWRHKNGSNPVSGPGLSQGTLWTDEQITGFETWGNLGAIHRYNLENGGWDRNVTVMPDEDGSSDKQYISKPLSHIRWAYENDKIDDEVQGSRYPAINIPLWFCRHGSGEKAWKIDAFYLWVIPNAAFGNSEPLVGYYIKDFKYWERKATGHQNTLTSEGEFEEAKQTYEIERFPTSTAFYSDRVWYSGAKGYRTTRTPEFLQTDTLDVSTNIYYSQSLRGDMSRAGLCYQAADPTAEDINDLVATDGGVISIPEMGEVVDMAVFGTSLLVFADNGVWAISGMDGNLFQADNMSVMKVSDAVAVSKTGISSEENSLIFLGQDAIYAVQPSEVTGMPQVQDISSERVGKFYERISNRSKRGSYSILDSRAGIFYMIYSDVPNEDITETISLVSEVIYNKALVVNLNTGAYYKYEFPVVGKEGEAEPLCIVGGFYANKDSVTTVEINVVEGENNVVEGSQNVVDMRSLSFVADNNIFLIGLTGGSSAAQAAVNAVELRFDDTESWADFENYPIKAYAEIGFDSLGDILRKSKMVPKIVSHMIRTETSFAEHQPEEVDPPQ